MIEIINKKDWQYVFFKFESDFYLLIPIGISAVSFHYLIKLNESEIENYKTLKYNYPASLSEQIRYYYQRYSDRNIFDNANNIISELKKVNGFKNMWI